jgi:hypothetical protein
VLNLEVAGRLLGGSGVCTRVYSTSYVRNLALLILRQRGGVGMALDDLRTHRTRDIAQELPAGFLAALQHVR